MPQASDELRHLIHRWFGDIDSAGPEAFLESRGFLIRAGRIHRPTPAHQYNWEELQCIYFLIDEWDYGIEPTIYKEYR